MLMELEEEGNKHVEEKEEEDDDDEKGGGEKREWEELSEKARNLVWVIESAKARREGKKSMSLKTMNKEKEEMEKNLQEAEKGREEEKKKREEEKRGFEERITRMKEEMEEIRKEGILHTPPPSNTPAITPIASSVITSLDGTSVTFTPSNDGIKREGNTIIHHEPNSHRNCFIGGEMTTV